MPDLNSQFSRWLKQYAEQWNLPVDHVALELGRDEIHNRLEVYPRLRTAIQNSSWDDVVSHLKASWALGGRFEAIRLNRFAEHGSEAEACIHRLIKDSSEQTPQNAVNQFVETAVELAYTVTTTGTADRAGAALLASVILTAAYSDRFVDFRRNRWEGLARILRYRKPPAGASYGELLVWAGRFAGTLARTPTFQLYWPTVEPHWVLSGICWRAQRPNRPTPDPADPADLGAFAEGEEKGRWHLTRERNQTLVRLAKDRRRQQDPSLRCDVCGFSFVQRYGERGADFIEAHHIIPLSKLRRSSRTHVEDLALVCSNCHRMLHRSPELTVPELSSRMVQTPRARRPAD